jgi:pentatricopeptide repeat protein
MHNEMLTAYATAGRAEEAERLLSSMIRVGPPPDSVSFAVVLQQYAVKRQYVLFVLHVVMTSSLSELQISATDRSLG